MAKRLGAASADNVTTAAAVQTVASAECLLSTHCGHSRSIYGVSMCDDEDQFEPLEEDQEWDEELARDLVGSTLFVGITHVDHAGNLIEKEQVFGSVESVAAGAGIKLIQTNGAPYVLAPVLDAIEPGDPDYYQLSEAHELVENPDFVMFVTATRPPQN